MPIEKFQAKPVIIEAILWTGNNWHEIREWTFGLTHLGINGKLRIETLEGTIYASVGDYIARGTQGEYYPIKPRVIADKYDKVVVGEERNEQSEESQPA
jgi:hypothetical protein